MEKIKKLFNLLQFYLYIGLRYLKSRNQKGKVNIIFLALFLGISLGLMVLIVVLGIMNGFQENHISRRIEIGSFHASITKKDGTNFNIEDSKKLKEQIYKNFSGIEAVIPYSDREGILKINKKNYSDEQIIKLRAVDPDEIKKDSRFMNFFKITYGKFDLSPNSILLGEALGYKIMSKLGGEVFLTPDISLGSFNSEGIPFKVNGYFYTQSYDYDRFWSFISINSLLSLSGNTDIEGLGIKFKDKNQKDQIVKNLKKYLDKEYSIQTAEEINIGFFSALKLEKVMIIFLFVLIFFMVATNTFGALKLTIIEKKKDIAILKSLGANPNDIKIIFLIESVVIGFTGTFSGVVLGFLISYNVINIFKFVELIINTLTGYLNYLLEFAVKGFYIPNIKIYDTTIYYQTNFIIKIDFFEIAGIALLVVIMTVIAAYIPVSKASKLKPNEIIRN